MDGKKIKIGGLEYTVNYYDRIVEDDGIENFGIVRYSEQEINISKDSTKQRQKMVLLHECIHAMDDLDGFGFDENKVRQVSNMLFNFMLDNKELIKFLIK